MLKEEHVLIQILTSRIFLYPFYIVWLHSLSLLPSWLSPSFYHGFCPSCSLSIELDLTMPWEQLGLGRSGQSHPAGTSSSGARGVPHGLLWEKMQSPQAKEIQLCVSKYKEQPPVWQTPGMMFDIFGFHCFHLHLCWLFTIKLLPSHFLQLHLSSAVLSMYFFLLSFLSPGLFPHGFFPLYLSWLLSSILIFFKQSSAPGTKSSFHLLHGKGTENCESSRTVSHSPSACRIYPVLKSFLSLDCFVCNNFRKCDEFLYGLFLLGWFAWWWYFVMKGHPSFTTIGSSSCSFSTMQSLQYKDYISYN